MVWFWLLCDWFETELDTHTLMHNAHRLINFGLMIWMSHFANFPFTYIDSFNLIILKNLQCTIIINIFHFIVILWHIVEIYWIAIVAGVYSVKKMGKTISLAHQKMYTHTGQPPQFDSKCHQKLSSFVVIVLIKFISKQIFLCINLIFFVIVIYSQVKYN